MKEVYIPHGINSRDETSARIKHQRKANQEQSKRQEGGREEKSPKLGPTRAKLSTIKVHESGATLQTIYQTEITTR